MKTVIFCLAGIQAGNSIKEIDILQGINYVIKAWDDVEPLTIKHCFKKAMPDIVEHSPATQPITPQISVCEESTRTLFPSSYSFDEFVNSDQFVCAYEPSEVSLEEPPSNITSDADSSEEEEIEESGKDELNDDDKQEEPAPKVKPKEVFQALNTLLLHSSRNGPSDEFAFLSNYLRKYSLEVDLAKKQTLMTDYFTKPSNSIC